MATLSPVNALSKSGHVREPENLLLLMAAAVPLSFATWQALINNFSFEQAGFSGVEIGTMQALREVPGFLAFAIVFVLLLIREQPLAIISLCLLGTGTAITGLFPTTLGIYLTTVLMSLGYHYYSTLQQSLVLQWIDKPRTPVVLGRIIAVGSFTSIAVYGLVWVGSIFSVSLWVIFAIGGGATVVVAVLAWRLFPEFEHQVEQHKHMVFRKRYWLYYALTFMSGARRQIFIVFAGFLMVEKFGYDVGAIASLFLLNAAINTWLAPLVGRLIARVGERHALIFEYVGLIGVFTAYAFVETPLLAAVLYVIDHLFFALAIAIETYFQKIADQADISSTAGISFTINHIAAVIIPVLFGYVWMVSPSSVFLAGAAMAACSLLLALKVPRHPGPHRETVNGFTSN